MEPSRAFTSQEIEETIYLQLATYARFWSAHVSNHNDYEKCLGMAHSILSMLAGCNINLPAFELHPSPHPDDEEYHLKIDENYYDNNTVVNLNGYDFYRTLEKNNIPKS